ncbi:hypothetical protein ABKY47_002060 [Aeromonas hydrophila]
MTKITAYSLVGWIGAGGLIGAGLSMLPVPPVAVALIAAGLATLSIMAGAACIGFPLLAAIIALSPAIMPMMPAWAAVFISLVIFLVITDLVIRFK